MGKEEVKRTSSIERKILGQLQQAARSMNLVRPQNISLVIFYYLYQVIKATDS